MLVPDTSRPFSYYILNIVYCVWLLLLQRLFVQLAFFETFYALEPVGSSRQRPLSALTSTIADVTHTQKKNYLLATYGE